MRTGRRADRPAFEPRSRRAIPGHPDPVLVASAASDAVRTAFVLGPLVLPWVIYRSSYEFGGGATFFWFPFTPVFWTGAPFALLYWVAALAFVVAAASSWIAGLLLARTAPRRRAGRRLLLGTALLLFIAAVGVPVAWPEGWFFLGREGVCNGQCVTTTRFVGPGWFAAWIGAAVAARRARIARRESLPPAAASDPLA